MAIQTGTGNGLRAAINMTPMIDVLLVLLIIFMAAAPVKPLGLHAAVPQSPRSPADDNERAVVLEIAKTGGFRINSVAVEQDGLGGLLGEIFKLRADRTLFLKADDALEYREVASAIAISRLAGVDRVALLPRR